jgi:hypothetical protein
LDSPKEKRAEVLEQIQQASGRLAGMPSQQVGGGLGQYLFHACAGRQSRRRTQRRELMLWTIFVVLVILWLLGFTLHIGGSLIHILIVIAVVVLIFNLISGRRSL